MPRPNRLFHPMELSRVLWISAASALLLLAPVNSAKADPPFVHTQIFRGAPEREDGTGRSIALTAKHILVASPDAKGLGPRVTVRIYDAASFAPVADIMTPDIPLPKVDFGGVTEMTEKHALICDEGHSSSQPGENIAVLHDVTTGQRLRRFRDPSGVKGSRFGNDCALSNRHALIAAPGAGAVKKRAGAAFLFDVETGDLLREFHPPTPQKGGGFGAKVVLSDRYAAISQTQRTPEIGGPGAVYIFDLESGHLARTFEKHEDDRGYVGALALQGDQILIGHTFGRVDGRKSGRIDIFDIRTRKHVRRILPPGLPKNSVFGADVVWSDNLILAGITEFRVGAEAYEGVAMLFDATTGAYLQTLARPPGEDVGIFPTRIAMAGGRILLSGLDDDVFVGGDAYLYERRAD